MQYIDMYKKAIKKINSAKLQGVYKKYTGANAASLWVYDNYGVNAGNNSLAHDALCDAIIEGNKP